MRLGVNIDHVATLRQARRANEPDPVAAAFLADRGGADGIVVHLREDRRHIQDRDLLILRKVVVSHLNLEMAVADEIVRAALSIRPDTATLVPERRQEITTEGGLDVVGQRRRLARAVSKLKDGGIRVSLFIDPEPAQVKASRLVGADAIELHTGAYAAAAAAERKSRLAILESAACQAKDMGLAVAAGHGLTYHNVAAVAASSIIEELNIGHSIIARAVFTGLEEAVREMVHIIQSARINTNTNHASEKNN